MAGMYPENEEITIFGEKVQWPGVDKSGKFTNGSFSDPHEPPSFIPAGTINLILDNLSNLITKLGGKPDKSSVTQLAELFTSAPQVNTGIMRDTAGRAKVATPVEADDIARKAEVDAEAQARTQGDNAISGQLSSHAGNKSNPHGVSKEQLGLSNVDNTKDADKSVKYAASARHSDTSNLLQAYTTDDYAGGNHFIKAIRESGWNMRLYGCYFNGAKQSDCVKVNYANSAGKAATADSAKNAETVGGYMAGNGAGMLVPVVAFNVGENAGYIKLGNGLIVQWGRFYASALRATLTMPIAFDSWNSYTVVTGDADYYNNSNDTEGFDCCAGINKRTNKTIEFSIAERGREIHWITIGF